MSGPVCNLPACRTATEPECKCACGGHNHGAGLVEQITVEIDGQLVPFSKLLDPRGGVLGYTNHVTGDSFWQADPPGRVVSEPKAKKSKRSAPPTPIEKAITEIVTNVQLTNLTGRAPLAFDEEV
jgi:hypothetical protein